MNVKTDVVLDSAENKLFIRAKLIQYILHFFLRPKACVNSSICNLPLTAICTSRNLTGSKNPTPNGGSSYIQERRLRLRIRGWRERNDRCTYAQAGLRLALI
jgi:hypothetical protein